MNTITLPDELTITITEEDRQSSDNFGCNGSCLLATAFKRVTGGQFVGEGVFSLWVAESRHGDLLATYDHPYFGTQESRRDLDATERPFYLPEVVGTTIHLTKRP